MDQLVLTLVHKELFQIKQIILAKSAKILAKTVRIQQQTVYHVLMVWS